MAKIELLETWAGVAEPLRALMGAGRVLCVP